jgi:hypothetical protein
MAVMMHPHSFVAPATEPGPTRGSIRRSVSRNASGSRLSLTAVRDDGAGVRRLGLTAVRDDMAGIRHG